MSTDGLSEKHFEIDEMRMMKEYALKIIKLIQSKTLIPTTEESASYENLTEKNKMLVSKVMNLRNQEPALFSTEIDWNEFYKSYADNLFLKSAILTFECIIKNLENARTVHDYTNYQLALKEIEHSASKKETDSRQEIKYNELKTFL